MRDVEQSFRCNSRSNEQPNLLIYSFSFVYFHMVLCLFHYLSIYGIFHVLLFSMVCLSFLHSRCLSLIYFFCFHLFLFYHLLLRFPFWLFSVICLFCFALSRSLLYSNSSLLSFSFVQTPCLLSHSFVFINCYDSFASCALFIVCIFCVCSFSFVHLIFVIVLSLVLYIFFLSFLVCSFWCLLSYSFFRYHFFSLIFSPRLK